MVLFSGLALVGSWTLRERLDWTILSLYGLMLFTTAIGLDFVYRGYRAHGAGGALAVRADRASTRSACSAWCRDASRIVWVPIWLTLGELSGIALVWRNYLKNYRMPRPGWSWRFLSIIIRRGRTVCLIHSRRR